MGVEGSDLTAGMGFNLWLGLNHKNNWFHLHWDMQENLDLWSLRPFLGSLPKAFVLKAKYLLLLHSSLMDNLMLMSDLTTYLNAYWTGSGGHFVSTKVGTSLIISLATDWI